MNISTLLVCFAILPLSACLGQATQATLLDNWHDNTIVPAAPYNNRYNECWGVGINGHEYGIIGSTVGFHFIDVTDPTNSFEAFRVAGAATGANLIHRDMKHYNGYLYCVADEGPSKLQIIDMNDLPNSVTQVYSSNEFVTTSHNLYIDTSQQRLYLLGAGGSTKVLDISNPTLPVLLASYPNANYYMPYTHDGYIEDNIGFFNCGGAGFWVIDFTNPLAPVTLSTMTNYTDAGYNHSGWVTEDGNYYLLCDETHGARVKVVDISDLTEPVVVATIEPSNYANEIPHNVLIRGNLAYFSYYYNGLEVWDISNPLNPQRAYFYDTYPGADGSSYAGAWGVYPNLPSGNILISDMQGGLFVFASVDGIPNTHIIPSEDAFDICAGSTILFDLTIGNGFTSNVTLGVGAGSLPADVQFSQNPAVPGSSVQVSVSNAASTLGIAENLYLVADNGLEASVTDISIAVSETPGTTALSLPTENATGVPLNASFEWAAVPGAASYKLQVADELAAFDANVVYSANTAATSFTLSNNLVPGTTYFWRVTSKNDCGSTLSDIRSFTTAGVNATWHLSDATLSIFPNPVKHDLVVASTQPLSTALRLVLTTLDGQRLLEQEFPMGSDRMTLAVNGFPAGVYFLKLHSEKEVMVQKVVVQ